MERMYNDIPEAVIQNGADIIEHVYNYASYLGWEVVDSSIVDSSSAFVVIKSVGGSKNNDRMPCYLRVYTNKSKIKVEFALAKSKKKHDKRRSIKEREQKAQAEELASGINQMSVTIYAKTGDGDRLFGSISASDIALAIKKAYDIDIDKKKITLSEHIKLLGEYECRVKLYANVSANLKVIIARKDK